MRVQVLKFNSNASKNLRFRAGWLAPWPGLFFLVGWLAPGWLLAGSWLAGLASAWGLLITAAGCCWVLLAAADCWSWLLRAGWGFINYCCRSPGGTLTMSKISSTL